MALLPVTKNISISIARTEKHHESCTSMMTCHILHGGISMIEPLDDQIKDFDPYNYGGLYMLYNEGLDCYNPPEGKIFNDKGAGLYWDIVKYTSLAWKVQAVVCADNFIEYLKRSSRNIATGLEKEFCDYIIEIKQKASTC